MSKTIANSQFVKLLRSLNNEELVDFEKELKVINGVEYKVLKFILKFKPNFESNKLDKEIAFNLIFKNEKYSYSKITNALSKLKKHLEEFLIQQELSNQSFARNYLLIQNLSRRNADDFFYKKIQDVQEELEEKTKIDAWHYLKILQLNHLKYYKANVERLNIKGNPIVATMQSLDEFFVANKLKYTCELFNRKNITQEDLAGSIFNMYTDSVSEKNDLTFFETYQLALKLIAFGNTKIYFELKEQMFENSQFLGKYDLNIINGYLLNFTNLEIKKGNEDFIREAFELYKFAESNEFLVVDGHITTMRFLNIINIACNLKETVWAKDFIIKWSNFLDKSDEYELIQVGKAMILFEEKKFSEVIDSLQFVKFDNILNEVRGRSLEMRSHFEIGNTIGNLLISKCNSLNIQVKRNKALGESVKKPIFAFIKIFKKLLNEKPDYINLIKTLNENPSVICKKWLIDKIETFK